MYKKARSAFVAICCCPYWPTALKTMFPPSAVYALVKKPLNSLARLTDVPLQL